MKVEEEDGTEADGGRLSAMVDTPSPGPGSVLKKGLAEKAAELASGSPDVTVDRERTRGSAEMVSAEDNITIPR